MMRRVAWFIAVAAFLSPQLANAECTLVSNGETRPTGTIIHNVDHDVLQACMNDGTWQALTPLQLNPCTGTPTGPSIGETCTDGSIYAGLSPDGNVPMYTTPDDQISAAYWGTFGFATGSTSSVTGRENSSDIYTHVQNGDGTFNPDDGYTPNAFVLCEELSAYGHNDWYLPALDELNVLYTNKNAGDLNGTFTESGLSPEGFYGASTEDDSETANGITFSDGTGGDLDENSTFAVRCVRR